MAASEPWKSREELLAEIAALRARLEEPEQTIEAIRSGQVDAFVIEGVDGDRVYTLRTEELLQQLHVITDTLPVLIAYVDREQRYRFNNRQYETWFGVSAAELAGRPIREVIGEPAYETVRPHVEAALAGREARFESWVSYGRAGTRCVQGTYVPHVDGGEVRGFISLVEDATERKRTERNLHLLADAGRMLAESLDPEHMLRQAAGLAAEAFDGWCVVDLLSEGGSLERTVLVHSDPARQPLLDELARFPPTWNPESGNRQAVETGRTVLLAEVTPALLAATLQSEEHGRIVTALDPRSIVSVPLVARGKLLGVWSFASSAPARSFTAEDVTVAEELARRAALAVDNARLLHEAQRASSAKDRFLATLSHELRTPLTPVLAVVSRFEGDARLPGDVQQGLAIMRRNVLVEARLIDDMLDLTRIERGKLELDCRPADVAEVIAQALETLSAGEIAAKGLRVATELAAPDHRVWADAPRLTQVFWNLLSNAVKFTPEGGAITVRSRRLGDRLEIEVADTGMGIEPAMLKRIFAAFDQGRAETGREFGGLGLGLAISRAIVELHGGELEAASGGPGQGATFIVRLPAQLAASAADTAPTETTAAVDGNGGEAAGRPLAILLVEDHPDTAEAMAELLRAMGHRVSVAASVAAALAAAEAAGRGGFDLVVSDLGLPDGSGLDVMRALAADHGVPGIALSGYGMEEDVSRSHEAGFDRHLTKPVDLQVLAAAIREVVRL